MSYQDRLQKSIILVSPSGANFSAHWVGNSRSKSKQLGIFKTPGVQGVIAQDLDVEADVYPLTFYFSGDNNDIESRKFYDACSERGRWEVIHPTEGDLTLQLVSVSQAIQPVTSGNVTEITTEWLDVIDPLGSISDAQIAGLVKALNLDLQSTTSDQLNNVVSLDTADKTSKFKTAVQNTVKAFNSTLQTVTSTVAEVQAQADSIKRGIDTALETVTDVLAIAGQVQALINLPNLIITDLNSKIDTYSKFADEILNGSPDTGSPGSINTAAVQELSLTAALGAVGVSSVITAQPSRQGVIDSIEANTELFTAITNGLDANQELYDGELLQNSYFSQSESWPDFARMSALTVAYLIKSSFDLSAEKVVVLTEEKNPVMVALEEYGSAGDNDENITLFTDSNNLTGQECYLLPVGFRYVVYL